MSDSIQLSLCIPTNGIVEWVKPVLDSIFAEKDPVGKYEVIVTDNGTNTEFEEFMTSYAKKYKNLIYKKTDAVQFDNQIEAFKLASGKFIKFVNHRMTLVPGALNYLLQVAAKYEKEKPFIYFLDAVNTKSGMFDSFDQFVNHLSYWSSYSGGVAMWKEDFDCIDFSKSRNTLFPHTDMIFSMRHKKNYIIDSHTIMKSLPTDETKKGKYNLFHAFAVEYPSIILDLYKSGDISFNTFENVKNDNFKFLMSLYLDYIILKKPCSYDLNNYKQSMSIYYGNKNIVINLVIQIIKRGSRKIRRTIKGFINDK